MSWRSRWGEGFGDLDAADGWNLYGSATGRALEDGGGGIPTNNRGPFLVLQVDGAGPGGWTVQDNPEDRFRVRPGELLRVRGWSARGGDPTNWTVGVGFYTAGNAWIDQLIAFSGLDGGGAWAAFEGTVTVPANAAMAAVILSANPIDPLGAQRWRAWDELVVEAWEPVSIVTGADLNLLPNGGFRGRDGLFRRPDRWTYANGGATLTLAKVCSAAEAAYVLNDGDYMAADEALGGSTLILEGTGNAGGPSYPRFEQVMTAAEGRRYALRGLLAGSDGSVASLKATPLLKDRATPAGAFLELARTIAGHPGGPELEGWEEVLGLLVTPPGTRFLKVEVLGIVNTPGAAFRVLFDQCGLWEEAYPGEWASRDDDATRAGLGYPAVYAGPGTTALPTLRYEHLTRSCSWQLGRSWWFASPEVGTASLELDGDRDELQAGHLLSFARDPLGSLWVGRIDDVTLEARVEDGEVVHTTRVTATDLTGWLAGTKLAGWNVNPQTFPERVSAVYLKAGAAIAPPTVMPSASAIASPGGGSIGAHGSTITAMEYLDQLEREANAITQIGPNGTVRCLKRDALPADTTGMAPPVVLKGDDCPVSVQLDRAAVGRVINLWRFGDAEELETTPLPVTGWTSAQTYGTREYDTKTVRQNADRYPATMRAVVAQALASYLVELSIHRRDQPAAAIGPFDLVGWETLKLQALQLAHNVTPDGWRLVLALDPTQTIIAGTPAPPPPPPEPVRKRATVSLTATADGYAVRTSGGLNAGNGASGNFLVGKLADGHLCRGFVSFARQTFLGRNRRVVSATLTLTTNRGGCMQWGSSPRVNVERVTASWSEGTHATACSFITGNALKYPGPAVTSSGKVSPSIPAADGRAVAIRVDAIAQAWLDGANQYGVRLTGYTETSSAYRAAFDASGGGRAKLVVVYEYDE